MQYGAYNYEGSYGQLHKQYFYGKELYGTYSIMYVLTVVCSGDPKLDYQNLEGIHNGSEAMSAYAVLERNLSEGISDLYERRNMVWN